jgi:SH3-like domain-containing protein
VGFFGGILLLAVFVFSNLFAWQQKQNLLFRKGAIVVSPSVTVKSTPAKNGTDLFVLHEGTKVDITDASMRGWLGIRIADGKEGWVERKQLEEI